MTLDSVEDKLQRHTSRPNKSVEKRKFLPRDADLKTDQGIKPLVPPAEGTARQPDQVLQRSEEKRIYLDR